MNRKYQIVEAFRDAMLVEHEADDWTEATEAAQTAAFNRAESFGWDHENDEKFMDWCLHATSEEILIVGLINALEKIDPNA